MNKPILKNKKEQKITGLSLVVISLILIAGLFAFSYIINLSDSENGKIYSNLTQITGATISNENDTLLIGDNQTLNESQSTEADSQIPEEPQSIISTLSDTSGGGGSGSSSIIIQDGEVGITDVATSSSCGYVNSDLTLTANVSTTTDCFIINASNIILDCAGFQIKGDKGSGDSGITSTTFTNVTIKNCYITLFGYGIRKSTNSNNDVVFNNSFTNNTYNIYITSSHYGQVYNNSFTDITDSYAVYLSDGDYWNITNNTFSGDFSNSPITLTSTSSNDKVWRNIFWSTSAISNSGTSNSFCVNDVGNFYNGSVSDVSSIQVSDCGPTPYGAVYANSSANINFEWNGTVATYPDLRTAVYNLWNGTNNTVVLQTNQSISSTVQESINTAVVIIRSNTNINCNNFALVYPVASSNIAGILANGETNVNIYNCIIDNYEYGIYSYGDGTSLNIFNNIFISGEEGYGVNVNLGDNNNITNNTFLGNYANAAIRIQSGGTNNRVWRNLFLGNDGISNSGTSNSFCVNDVGNFYNGSIGINDNEVEQIQSTDCGPTPYGTVYVNSSANTTFEWNGTIATYPDLRTALYNLWNGANNTVTLKSNQSIADDVNAGLNSAVLVIRNNTRLNCDGYTIGDQAASSGNVGIMVNGQTNVSIFNCVIDNFEYGINSYGNGTSMNIFNNTFMGGEEGYGIYIKNGDYNNITNNTFLDNYIDAAINIQPDGVGNNIWMNSFLGLDGISNSGVNTSLCVNSFGNYYNGSVSSSQVLSIDCGPTPNSNVSVNSSYSSSNWSFSTSSTANPIYTNIQEAYYNNNINKTIWLNSNLSNSATTKTIRNGTILNCQNYSITSADDGINIDGESGNTITNCKIFTSTINNDGITLTSSATGNKIINTIFNLTGLSSYGVYFISSNNNEIINSTFYVNQSNDVYSDGSNNNSIINCVFDRSDLGFTGTNSWIQVKWYVDVNVTNGTAGLASATVNIVNRTTTNIFNGLTDENGQIATQTITEFMQSASGKVFETPHNFSANKTGFSIDSELVNLTQTNSTTVVLGLANTLYPDYYVNQTSMNYSSISTIKQNDTIEINVTSSNLGNINGSEVNLSFYVDSILNQSRLINITLDTPQIVRFNWTAIGGNHTLEIKADPNNLVEESNETNNNATRNISVKYVAVLDYLGPSGSFPRGKDITGEDTLMEVNNTLNLTARVYDLFNSSHGMRANCSFYLDEVFLGINYTDTSGYCSYILDKTTYSADDYLMKVNFTDLEADAVNHTFGYENSSQINIFVMNIDLTTINHYDGLNYQLGEMAVMNITITKNGTAYSPDIINPTIRGPLDALDGPSLFPSVLYNDSIGLHRYASLINSTPNGDAVRWRIRVNSTTEGLIGTASHSDVKYDPNDGNLYLRAINSSGENIANTILSVYDSAGYNLIQTSSLINNSPIRKVKNHTIDVVVPNGARFYFDRMNLNETNNNITIQLIDTYAQPRNIKNISSIMGIESLPYSFVGANITLPKNGFEVDRILRCTQWNSTTGNCTGEWSTLGIAFEQNSTHIWFNVSSFSGYAGGLGYNANLTIWDQNDSFTPLGQQASAADEQIQFYANYTNSTSGAVIYGANCTIAFDDDASTFNMSFNTTYNIYQYNRSFSSSGYYVWNVTCVNESYDLLTAIDNITIHPAQDNYPYWNTNQTAISEIYNSSRQSYFNITWLDETMVSSVWFESNYSGTTTNYSMNRISGTNKDGVYNYSKVLPAGSFYWKSYGVDSTSQLNYSDTYYFNISKAASLVNLTLDGLNANLTIATDVNVEINCSVLLGEGNVTLYANGSYSLSNESVNLVTSWVTPEIVNITCIHSATQNYTANYSTYWLTIIDNVSPYFDPLPINLTLEFGTDLNYDINASDNVAVDTFTVNNSNFTINSSGVLVNATGLSVGNYSMNITVNDTSGNINSTIFNVYVRDTTAPTFTSISNQSLVYGSALGVQFTATDLSGVSAWNINDTTWFSINNSGYLSNATGLNVSTYYLNISVNDTYNNINSQVITITVTEQASSSSSSSSGGGGGGGGGTSSFFPACKSDSDCPSSTSKYCESNKIVEKNDLYECINANLINAECKFKDSEIKIVDSCEYGCDKAKCLPQPIAEASLPSKNESEPLKQALVGAAIGQVREIAYWLKLFVTLFILIALLIGLIMMVVGHRRKKKEEKVESVKVVERIKPTEKAAPEMIVVKQPLPEQPTGERKPGSVIRVYKQKPHYDLTKRPNHMPREELSEQVIRINERVRKI